MTALSNIIGLLVAAACLSLLPACTPRQAVTGAQEEPTLKVMSYNVRRHVESDGENAWPNRRDFLASQIDFYAPDVLGVQEDFPEHVAWLGERLSTYGRVGQGREGPNLGEHCSIFYNRRRLEMNKTGTFWLSETPNEVSTGWDARYPRVVTWARFTDRRSGKGFLALNTHLDHQGRRARANSLDLVLTMLPEINPTNLPYVFMGDFNLRPESEPMQQLSGKLTDAFVVAPSRLGPEVTFAGFSGDNEGRRRVDYLMLSAGFEVINYATLTDRIDGRHASDHFPILTTLRLSAR